MDWNNALRLIRHATAGGVLALAALGGVPVHAQSAAAVATRDAPDLGTFLTDQAGRTLYMYTRDDIGLSNCYDACAAAWPPLLTDADPSGPDGIAAGLGTTQRTDGSVQVTYNGMPLYYWSKDQKPGDTTGQNVGGVWFVVNP
jgi:predicted lipoprotein with Yx(FWY)xxD motif